MKNKVLLTLCAIAFSLPMVSMAASNHLFPKHTVKVILTNNYGQLALGEYDTQDMDMTIAGGTLPTNFQGTYGFHLGGVNFLLHLNKPNTLTEVGSLYCKKGSIGAPGNHLWQCSTTGPIKIANQECSDSDANEVTCHITLSK